MHMCVCLFMYCLARQQLSVECEWVRMKLKIKKIKKTGKKKLDELQSIGAGSLY